MSDLLSDTGRFAETMDALLGMFDREVFDYMAASGPRAAAFAGALCDRLRKPLILIGDGDGSVIAGRRAVVLMDTLREGKRELDIVRELESKGGQVIRIGFLQEETAYGARRNKVLKGYPFEAVLVIRSFFRITAFSCP